jgi:hypothetical protein
MSELRIDTPEGQLEIRQAPSRPSASGPGDVIANARDIAIYFREDCRGLRDSLQLEMVVAQYVLRIRAVLTTEGVGVGQAVGLAVIAQLEHERDPLSLAILLGLAQLANGATAERAHAAAERLAEEGVELPRQFAGVGRAEPVGAWRASGAEGEFVLFVEFEHPCGRRHTFAMFAEPRGAGTVKHLALLGPSSDLAGAGRFDPDVMEALDLPEAGALMRDLLGRTYGPPAADVEDFRVLIAEARAQATCGVQA